MNDKKSIFVVLGMHRSGTSALTRALNTLGVDLGDNLMKPIADVNEKGFYEDLDINSFNDYLLSKMNCTWCSPEIPQNNQLDLLNNNINITKAVELLKNKVNNVKIFGFKDPRVSVLLPFWQNIFNICNLNVNYLIAVRNPLSVAKSLNKRDNFSENKGLFLWGQYMLAILEYTDQKNRVFISYEDLMQNPNFQLQKIAKTFDLSINTEDLKTYTNEFLDSSLQHGNLSLDDLKNSDINTKSIYNVYLYIIDLIKNEPSLKNKLLNIKENYSSDIKLYLNEFFYQDYLFREKNNLNNQINGLNNQVNGLNNQVNGLNNQVNDLNNQVIDLSKQINVLINGNKILDNHLHETHYHLDERLKIINRLIQENSDLHEIIKSHVNHIEFIENNLKNIQSSFVMKITQPIRYIKSLLTK